LIKFIKAPSRCDHRSVRASPSRSSTVLQATFDQIAIQLACVVGKATH
jgi:hypothetical protein